MAKPLGDRPAEELMERGSALTALARKYARSRPEDALWLAQAGGQMQGAASVLLDHPEALESAAGVVRVILDAAQSRWPGMGLPFE